MVKQVAVRFHRPTLALCMAGVATALLAPDWHKVIYFYGCSVAAWLFVRAIESLSDLRIDKEGL